MDKAPPEGARPALAAPAGEYGEVVDLAAAAGLVSLSTQKLASRMSICRHESLQSARNGRSIMRWGGAGQAWRVTASCHRYLVFVLNKVPHWIKENTSLTVPLQASFPWESSMKRTTPVPAARATFHWYERPVCWPRSTLHTKNVRLHEPEEVQRNTQGLATEIICGSYKKVVGRAWRCPSE